MKKHLAVLSMTSSLVLLMSAAPSSNDSATALTDRQRALHVLNRLGFGARPGDVDRVLTMGLDRYIDEQLHPERISDARSEALLAKFPTLTLSAADTWDQFERPLREARKQAKKLQAENAPANGEAQSPDMQSTAGGKKNGAVADFRKQIPPDKRPQRLVAELTGARIVRAAYSERQLNEVMVDFWMNHFNVYAAKGLDRVLIGSYERDTVRPRVWGRFEDLLMATAKSPAMLFYLDNARSVAAAENRPATVRDGPRQGGAFGEQELLNRRRQAMRGEPRLDSMRKRRPAKSFPAKGGLNENYARELMELHTLGVDGGYTQQDVTELARVLTGWSIARPEEGGGFVFRAALHDTKPKKVLGNVFPAGGGIREGETMIHILAHHPATAHHIAFQLCQRLVADEPPAALVDRVAKTFLATDGDLRQTVRAIVSSPEFFDPIYYRAKMKSPFEYVVSSLRATGGELNRPLALARQLQSMGEPLYLCQPPTGYSDTSNAWMNSGSLLARLNFALDLTGGRIEGVAVDSSRLLPDQFHGDSSALIDSLARELVGGDLSPDTRRTIDTNLVDKAAREQSALVGGLILGSPDFQRQ